MPSAIIITQYGGPDVLHWQAVQVGEPGPNELLIRHTAIGVNFHDIYVRSGSYRTLALPGTPGIEAAGIVEKVGTGVANFMVGDRIAYVSASYGAYAENRIIDADLLIRLPDAIPDQVAAGFLVKGLTAQMLVRQVRQVRAGETILVHAAAGGVGQVLCRWATGLGATVIGTVGSAQKRQVAMEAGCRHVLVTDGQNIGASVRDITGGKGVEAAYDSVGRATFETSMSALASCGHLVNFGQSSGPVEPVSMSRLSEKSTTVSRPILFHYMADRASRDAMLNDVFDNVATGVLAPDTPRSFRLRDAALAHSALESRATSGPIVLVP